MAFDKREFHVNNFQRNDKLTENIVRAEEKEKEVVIQPTPSRTPKRKKEYMTLNFYPEEKAKLKRLAEQEGKSVSQVIEDWLATIAD